MQLLYEITVLLSDVKGRGAVSFSKAEPRPHTTTLCAVRSRDQARATVCVYLHNDLYAFSKGVGPAMYLDGVHYDCYVP